MEGVAELSGQFVGGCGGSDKSSVVSFQVDVEGVAELSGQFVGGCGGSGRAQWSVCRWMCRAWQSAVVSL